MYDFYLNDKKIDDIIEFSYSENLEDVASSFSFTALHDYGITTNDKLNNIKICEKGKKTPFYFGYITDCEHTTKIDEWQYTGFDVGFYLNKNEVLHQFKNKTIIQALEELCAENQVDIGDIPKFVSSVSKTYKEDTFADVIKDLLKLESDKGGIKDVYIDCKLNDLSIKQYQYELNLSTTISNNILLDANKTLTDITVKNSIQELKNNIRVTDNTKLYKEFKPAFDKKSQKKYGLLTHVEQVDTKKTNNLQKIAQDKLNELNKEKTEINLSMLCDYRLSKGKLIVLDVPKYNLKGTYLVKQVTHAISDHKDYATINISLK